MIIIIIDKPAKYVYARKLKSIKLKTQVYIVYYTYTN